MKVGELSDYLIKLYKVGAINHQRPSILLLGPPGIGKTMSCWYLGERLASMLHREFIDYNDDVAFKILSDPEKYFVFTDFRLTECEPSDLLGIPRETDSSTRYYPLLWARCLSKTPGILLLDEITKGILALLWLYPRECSTSRYYYCSV